MEFFAITGEFSLNKSTLFQSGHVYEMNVTSGAAVATLLFDLFDVKKSAISDEKGEHITDSKILCVCWLYVVPLGELVLSFSSSVYRGSSIIMIQLITVISTTH